MGDTQVILSKARLRRVELVAIVLVITLSISSASILVILSRLNAGSASLWRLLLSTLILFALDHKGLRELTGKTLLLTVVAGVALGLHFTLWMESLFLIPVFESTLLVDTYPLLLTLYEKTFLKARVRPKEILGLSVASLLLYIFLGGVKQGFTIGHVYALISSFFISVYFLLGRLLRHDFNLPTTTYVIPTYATATITSLIYCLFNSSIEIPATPSSLFFVVLLAIVPMIGGHTMMNYLLKLYKSNTVSSLSLVEPIGASILAYLILGQAEPPLKLAVGIGVVVSVLYTWL